MTTMPTPERPPLKLPPLSTDERKRWRQSLMGNLAVMGRIYHIVDPLRALKQIDDLEAERDQALARVEIAVEALEQMLQSDWWWSTPRMQEKARAALAKLKEMG